MIINVVSGDLQVIRDHIREGMVHLDAIGTLHAIADAKILRNFNRELNAALKKIHGHDCRGDDYL